MSEIEKAIEVLTDRHTQIGTTAPNDTAWRLLKPAMDTAIEALQEKLERDKGCYFCNQTIMQFRAKLPNSDVWNNEYCEPKVCPMCGKKLERR